MSLSNFRTTFDAKYATVMHMSFKASESTWKRADSVSKALGILFSELQNLSPISAAVLRVCAHFGTWVIDTDLLSSALTALAHNEQVHDLGFRCQMPQDDFDLRKAVDDLAESFLVKLKRSPDGQQQIRMHGLLSRWCVECLEQKLEWAMLACTCITLIIQKSVSDA